jgi:hypothetical protein
VRVWQRRDPAPAPQRRGLTSRGRGHGGLGLGAGQERGRGGAGELAEVADQVGLVGIAAVGGEVNFLQYLHAGGAYRCCRCRRPVAAIPSPRLGGDRAGQAGRAAAGVAAAPGLRPPRVGRSGAVVQTSDVRGHGQLSPLLLRGLAGAAGRRAAGRRGASAPPPPRRSPTRWAKPTVEGQCLEIAL